MSLPASVRILIAALFASLIAGTATAQTFDQPRRVRVPIASEQELSRLFSSGLDVVDVRGSHADLLVRPGDEARLASLGLSATLLDEHPGRTAAAEARADWQRLGVRPPARDAAGRTDSRTLVAPSYGAGSMAGYWTTAEIKAKLDDLVANDPLGLVAAKIDTVGYSTQGRPVWGLRIGKAVTGPDTRPVVFLNALTHAREPGGMQTLFYFVDHLLARYVGDLFARYLLDQRVIYIVPIVNPDGYAVNENTYFSSGGTTLGYWRKNTRDNNSNGVFDPNDGVDINRNFGVQWGLDSGSSPDPLDETYRGPSPFSEYESVVQRNLVASLQPKTAYSFHTYSDLLLHPWGWTITPTGHSDAFDEWGDEMSRLNGYAHGAAPRILYEVSGEFNDWCYGDTLLKPRLFSWTPEVGAYDDGDFWPVPSKIVPIATRMMHACYVLAAIAGPFVQEDGLTITEGAMNAGRLTNLRVRARNLGLASTAAGLNGTLLPIDAGANVLNGVVGYPTIGSRQSADPSGISRFQVALDDTVTPGRLMRFMVEFRDNAGLYSRDTLTIPAGTPTLVWQDFASSGLANWTPGTWNVVTGDPLHPSRYFTDSPPGDYAAAASNIFYSKIRLNLTAGVHAYAFYEARWQIEQDYDGVYLEATPDSVGIPFAPVAATGMIPGSGIGVQTAGKPLYTGARYRWRPEIADLSAYTGAGKANVRLRFRLHSDSGGELDGMAIDSLRIMIYDPAAQPGPVSVDATVPVAFALSAPTPNPSRGPVRFTLALPESKAVRLEILDIAGRRVRTLVEGALGAGTWSQGWDLGDESGRKVRPGVYLARFSGGLESAVRRIVVID